MIEINKNAQVKCSKTICIDTAVQKVWSVMANIDAWQVGKKTFTTLN